MDERMRTLLLVTGVTALAVALGWGMSRRAGNSTGQGGDVIWRQGMPRGHERYCAPADIAGPLTTPHTLYRRPPRCGHGVTCLIDNGWEWIINPPSEAGIGVAE
jgi:hypothetical protein